MFFYLNNKSADSLKHIYYNANASNYQSLDIGPLMPHLNITVSLLVCDVLIRINNFWKYVTPVHLPQYFTVQCLCSQLPGSKVVT